jgi:N-acetylneuraminic acid mutarotase
MKYLLKISGLILFILLFNLFNSCKKDKPTPPGITTTAVTEISFTSSISGGDVTNEGSSPVLSFGICWNTSPAPTIENSKTVQNGASGVFVSNMTQLSQNTKYYVKAYATNGIGTSYGNEVSFTTLEDTVPLLTTAMIDSVKVSSAISGGNIITDNGQPVTARGVCWNTTNNPTISDSKTTDGIGIGTFISKIAGLSKGTTYHVRSYATNSVGTSYGEDLSFTTLDMEWIQSTEFPGQARWLPLSFTYNGKGYFGLGRNSNNPAVENLKDFWRFDPVNSTWTRLGDCPFTFTTGLTSKCLVGSILYVIKDWALYSYDLSNDGWQFICNSPYPLSLTSCFSIDNKPFFFNKSNSELYEFNSQDKTFSKKTALIDGFLNYNLNETFVINNEAFLLHKNDTKVEIYHYISQSDTWEKKQEKEFSSLAFDQASFIITSNNNAFIGQSCSFFVSSLDDNAIVTPQMPSSNVWKYDYLKNEFKQVVSLPGDFRAQAGCFSFDNNGYVIGGATVDSNTQHFRYLNDSWILN